MSNSAFVVSSSWIAGLCLALAGCVGGRPVQQPPPYSGQKPHQSWSPAVQAQRYPIYHVNAPANQPATSPANVRLTQYQHQANFQTHPHDLQNSRPIDFSTALSMAAGQNPQVEFANARIREAMAQLHGAQTLWLPSIRGGVNYNKHDGTLQASGGAVTDVNRASLQTGLGLRAIGAGTPAVPGVAAKFHTTDALFQPRIAGLRTAARHDEARATKNDVLLETSLAYLELLRSAQQQRIAEETRHHARQLADMTTTFADSGQGGQADADRARTELSLRENEVVRAEEAAAVASTRLAELLHVDPSTTLLPQETGVMTIHLVAANMPRNEMLATGLSNRPELAQSRHLVGEAIERLRRERFAPLVPSVLLGMSYSGFGGSAGSSSTTNFAERLDFDAAAYWEVRNLGFGEASARNEARARIDQARLRQVQTMDRVAREIAEAHAQVTSRVRQIATAEGGVQAALASYERNISRIRQAQGLPLEVLQSIQALDQARRESLRALVDYNEAQFRLHRALGCPTQCM